MGNFLSQSFFCGKPTLTEHNCPDQQSRVYIVTGGYTGVGYELSRILFARNAIVYIAGRSESKATDAIARIQQANGNSLGRLEFLSLDLADLSTIKPAVELFLSKEQRLDVLVNNAAVMFPPVGSITAQSYDLQLGTNCLGPYLLYKLLSPMLSRTATVSATASVRVLWAGAVGIDVLSPQPGGMKLNDDGSSDTKGVSNDVNYAQTKAGNLFFARQLARSDTSVIHLCFNPGNLRTELQRHWVGLSAKITDLVLLYPAVYGGYTELWATIAPEVVPEKSGSYIWPWGRFGSVRHDVEMAVLPKTEGGTGMSERFVAWCDKQVAPFM